MLARSVLRLHHIRSHPVRSFYTSSSLLAENNGVFGRFNPWAKKPETSTVNDNTSTTNDKNTSVESIGNVTFDVNYHDEQEFTSWKNSTVIEDVAQIRSSIRNIVSEHIQGVDDVNWKDTSLVEKDIKFKVVKEAMKQIGKDVPNLELNNINTVNDLLAFYERKPDITQTSIEKYFAENASSLPPNLVFEASDK